MERKFAVGVAALLLHGWTFGARARARGRRYRTAAFGRMDRPGGGVVEVHGRRAEGAELGVIFCNGLGLPHEQWDWVCGNLPDNVAYVRYNRPGYGLSSPLPGAPTAEEQLKVIDELRDRYLGGLPLVLAGHSLGGHLAAAYAASRTEGDVSHVVMVDPLVLGQLKALRGGPDDLWRRQQLLIERVWAASGLNVLRPSSPVRETYAEETRESITDFHALPSVWATAYREYVTAFSYPAIARLAAPVHVVTALRTARNAEGHRRAQAGLRDLSGRFRHHVIEDADHMRVLAEETHARTVAELIVSGGMA
ncbi:alpha/beta hydrolase [Streptomyces hoynatensis]|uniref:Alpha/beta hydrolase n=2 Tax=Streptomyces hoynatensis TaxID=1141874 RepID=A0A3A9YF83_9ACTN|nr:alpha/beta hydrolase [Streptomyces hoynatensis]